MTFLRALKLLLALAYGLGVVWPARRLAARSGARLFGRAALCRGLLDALRVRVVVSGRAAPGPVLFVANHVSWIDVPALRLAEDFCFLAKREVGLWPLIGRAARAQGTVFVDRRRRRSIPGANALMARRLADGRRMLMFPQGTTLDADAAPRFFSSHFASLRDFLARDLSAGHAFVQPMAICYSSPVAPWLGDDALLPHLWRVLREGGMECRISFCEPLAVGRGFDRKALAREAAARVEAALQATRRADSPAPEPAEGAAVLALAGAARP
ncbi:lysophospholipid acyltransferase family protein [Methylocella sp.]|uniref:lysophospholipid acyltransferase family protein n=1 Tax=Methylocella sp. TaxID=1978226 RepID=UPI003783ADBA